MKVWLKIHVCVKLLVSKMHHVACLDCRVQTREMISVPWIHVVRIGKYFKGNHHTEATALLWLRVKSLRINNRKASSPSFANMFVNQAAVHQTKQNGF